MLTLRSEDSLEGDPPSERPPRESFVGALPVKPRRHWLEVAYATLTIAVLAINWPWLWLNRQNTLDALEASDARGTLLFLLLFGTAGVLLTNDWPTVFRIVRGEPLLFALIALSVISMLWAYSPEITARRSVGLLLSALFGVYLVVRFPLPQLLRIVAWVALLRVALDYALVFGLPDIGVTSADQWQGRAPGKNNLGRDSVLGGMIMIWHVIGNRQFRLLFVLGTVGAFGLVLGSQSTTAFVSMILLTLALPVYQMLRAKKTLFGAVLVSLGGGSMLAAAVSLSQLPAITSALGKDVTLTGRTTLWVDSIAAIADRPILGAGFGSFWLGWFSPNHDIWVALGSFRTPHAHNGLIDVALDLGIIGALLYAGVFVRSTIRAIRFCRLYAGVAGLFPLGYMALSVLGSSTEHGVMSPNTLLWVLFVATVSALTAVKGERVDVDMLAPVGAGKSRHR